MIKKAVLTLTIAPFLMVFSDLVFSDEYYYFHINNRAGSFGSSPDESCRNYVQSDSPAVSDTYFLVSNSNSSSGKACRYYVAGGYTTSNIIKSSASECPQSVASGCGDANYVAYLENNPLALPTKTDQECQSEFGGAETRLVSESDSYGYSAGYGACTVKASGATVCITASDHQPAQCSSTWIAESTGDYGNYAPDSEGGSPGAPTEFNVPDYLNALPGECTASSCVQIGDTAYLVDWDTAPDWFEYTDANGNTISGPSGGDPTDPGGDNGGGDTGGDPDDGSTVPDFEFDESGVIEAIGSAGQSNQNAINALSNDVTGAISSQTNTLTDSLTDQTTDLTTATTNQTDALTDSLDDQTTDVTDAIGDQTGSLNSKLGDLQTAIVDGMKNITVRVSGGGGGSSGGSDGEGDGEGDGEEEGFLDTLIDKLASLFDAKFEEAATSSELPSDGDTAGMIDGEGVTDEIIQSLDQEAEQENTAIYDEFEGIFEGGGIIDGALSPLRDFVTSFLPSLPTGGCTPLVFGAGERSFTIDCEGFNLLKAALSWVLFFFTAYQLISIPMDARKAQQ